MSCAILAFHNTPSGRYAWWDDFPQLLASRLAEYGIDFHAFYCDYHADSAWPANHRRPVPFEALGHRKWLRAEVVPLLRQYDSVILHTHSYYAPNHLWMQIAGQPRRWWYMTEHRIGSTEAPLWKRSLRSLGRELGIGPHKVFAVSDAGACRAAALFGQQRVLRIHNGIRLPRGYPPPRRDARPTRALYVGRLDPKKGITELVMAFRVLRDRGSDASLDVVGGGPLEVPLKEFVAAYGLGDRVRLWRHQPDPKWFYRKADFVVIPTRIQEALSLVSLEARCHRLPAIYANSGGLPETRSHGIDGLALPSVSPEEIANSVDELQADPARYARMSFNCTRGLDYFSIDRMVDEYLREYLTQFASVAGVPIAADVAPSVTVLAGGNSQRTDQ